MKKIIVAVAVYLFVVFCCIVAFNKFVLAEVPIKYNGKICKMEILSSADKEKISPKFAKQEIEQDVLAFCKDKYIYNIEVAMDKGNVIYVIIYNDKN